VLYQYAMRIYMIDDTLPQKIGMERLKVLPTFGQATFLEVNGG